MKVRQALEILRERGMCKHQLEDSGGRVCAYGALNIAYSGNSQHTVFVSQGDDGWTSDSIALLQTAKALFPDRSLDYESLAVFNNHEDTTQEDLELVFEKTAVELGEMV